MAQARLRDARGLRRERPLPTSAPDVLVIANPVWETTSLVDQLPIEAPGIGAKPGRCAGFGKGESLAYADGGGSALNSACALAAAGWFVAVRGRVGDDAEGHASVESLRRHGVHTRIEVVAGRATKRNHIYVEQATGAPAFDAVIPDLAVQPWEETPAEILEARVVLFDRLSPKARDWMAARRDARSGWNALNRNTPGRDGLAEARFRSVLPFLDYLQLPEADAGASVGPHAPIHPGGRIHRPVPFPRLGEDAIRDLLAGGVGLLVLTRGAEGAVLHRPGSHPFAVPAVPVETVVDVTGAGDAFVAGVLDRLLAGATIEDGMRRGTDWAARACASAGARGWIALRPPERSS